MEEKLMMGMWVDGGSQCAIMEHEKEKIRWTKKNSEMQREGENN